MFRLRRLLWLVAIVVLAYVIWRWRGQQTDNLSVPVAMPPTPPLPPVVPPSNGPAAGEPANSTGARRIATRVHRGAPPARPAVAPTAPLAPEEPPDSSPAPEAMKALALGASKEEIEETSEESAESSAESATTADVTPAVAEEPAILGASVAVEVPQGLVNINTADAATLIALPGIGPALATRIIAYREQHGPFSNIEQLIDIQGIGTRNLDEFRHLITV